MGAQHQDSPQRQHYQSHTPVQGKVHTDQNFQSMHVSQPLQQTSFHHFNPTSNPFFFPSYPLPIVHTAPFFSTSSPPFFSFVHCLSISPSLSPPHSSLPSSPPSPPTSSHPAPPSSHPAPPSSHPAPLSSHPLPSSNSPHPYIHTHYGPHNTLLIDDSLKKALSEPFNHIVVAEWEGPNHGLGDEDEELMRVRDLIEEVRRVECVAKGMYLRICSQKGAALGQEGQK